MRFGCINLFNVYQHFTGMEKGGDVQIANIKLLIPPLNSKKHKCKNFRNSIYYTELLP